MGKVTLNLLYRECNSFKNSIYLDEKETYASNKLIFSIFVV